MSVTDNWVGRFSVDETHKHKNGFTIYKITSVLFPLGSPEAVTVVSVWKRYSDVQQLHKAMVSLHAGLHLKGTFPQLPKWSTTSYFKRFDPEVVQDRAKSIKNLLEFIAEHRLLFTSAKFVSFLESGYPEPEDKQPVGPINTITLHLPIEETPPLEYQSDEEDSRSEVLASHEEAPNSSKTERRSIIGTNTKLDTEFNISEIQIFEAADVEIRKSPRKLSPTDSFESLDSLDSISSDLYEELNKITVDKIRPSVKKKNILPDLINFEDQPSTSKFEDYHNICRKNNSIVPLDDSISETTSLNSTLYDASITSLGRAESMRSMVEYCRRPSSRQSLYSKKSMTFSTTSLDSKTRTENSYIFEAGYLLNLASTCEELGDYHRAFECYKSGIEKMLIGVQSDTDKQRRELVKEKTNVYLSYAEKIYRDHLSDNNIQILSNTEDTLARPALCSLPLSMLKRSYSELTQYRVLAVLASTMMMVLHRVDQKCYAMKVIQKVPNNLTEFDEYFLQRTNETKIPVLPTNIPYMVPLNSYIETTNLIFLILAYAPGEKLLDYIQNYAKSTPNTPAREVNLENVFVEPKIHRNEPRNYNNNPEESRDDTMSTNPKMDFIVNKGCQGNHNFESTNESHNLECIDNMQVSVNDLVINSQRLLMNVDLALSGALKISEEVTDNSKISETKMQTKDKENKVVTTQTDTNDLKVCLRPIREVISSTTICKWGAELLVAIECLHNAGVICRDLNPNNILLGECGQIILTYFIGYDGLDMILSILEKQVKPGEVNLYIAPEIYHNTFLDPEQSENGDNLDKACDFWSFGAVMYDLICGVLSDNFCVTFVAALTYSPSERPGAGKEGVQEIKSHPYFKNIDWKS
ncbi:Ribosomal protein S6 kinase-like 1 [Eumeta japonica]|uniref:Ribosomal protein S6 kinase-like 1 n=1 Tax=Eumeta variegata TaxID=151549 RepID=A0A4C2AFB5_EUMVA|nr:Ribosomal protein S6 kinase-like 1 [Eumeta japonica]